MPPSVRSVNVALPTEIRSGGEVIRTGIFKKPVIGRVRVRRLNLDGDQQADLKVHGGPDKAVYVYPSEHYEFWERELGRAFPEWGTFGENLTIQGTLEDGISIGDTLRIGTALLQVTQPRLPCFKLAAKLERKDIIKKFLDSRRTGFYVRVLEEGIVESDDAITIRRDPFQITVREIIDLYLNTHPKRATLERVLSAEALSSAWRNHFERLT